MSLTLVLGFHYDNSLCNNSLVQRLEHDHNLQALPVAGSVIDVLPERETRNQKDFGSGHKLFLTYNFRGQPEPVWTDISALNIYV